MKLKAATALAAALTLAAMPAAFAQVGGGAPLPSQRITMNATAGHGAPLTLSPSTVRRTQQELNRLGYNAGTINGTIDRTTRTALIEFQKAHRLEPSGTIDETTLRALGVNPLRGMRSTMGNGGGRMLAENGGAMANGSSVMHGEAARANGGSGEAMNGGYGGGMNGGGNGAGMR